MVGVVRFGGGINLFEPVLAGRSAAIAETSVCLDAWFDAG